MCYVHQKNSSELIKNELTADEWLGIASEARELGLIFLLLTGGEPFLREDFPYIYEKLVKMGFLVSINTNASLYNKEIHELFCKYPPSRINVTLYGGSEETYGSLCGNMSFHKVISNLKMMKSAGLQVRLNVSLTPYNIGDMEKIDRISREIGLQVKAASYMYPPVRVDGRIGQNDARFTASEAGRAMARWNQIRDTYDMYQKRAERLMAFETPDEDEVCSDVEAAVQDGVRCRAGRSSFWLTWNGKMLPCGTMDIDPSYPLRDGFKTAWEEVKARTAAIRLPIECSVCEYKNSCGVCASVCKGETGRFDCRPDFMCEMMRSLRENTVALAKEMKEGKTNEA